MDGPNTFRFARAEGEETLPSKSRSERNDHKRDQAGSGSNDKQRQQGQGGGQQQRSGGSGGSGGESGGQRR